jgi:hypothetical protein
MGLLNFANAQSAAPVDTNAPMTLEQFVAQNPDAYSQENSNPSYDYMLYQMQQENAAKAQAEAQLKQTDPRAYAAQKAEEATSILFNDFATNGRASALTPNSQQWVNESKAFLESIKESDPLAYWNAQLSLNLQKAGWDAGQGKVNQETNAKIQDALQNAQANGLPQEQINNLIKINYEGMAKSHADNIAQRKGQGATLQGIEKVLPAFAAMATAGALAPAAGVLEAGAGGLDAYMSSAGLTPGMFEGAAFTLPEGLGGTYSSMSDYMTKAGLEPGKFEGAAFQMPNSLTAKDVIKYANQAKKTLDIGNTLAKVLGGNTTGNATTTANNPNAAALANLLNPNPTGAVNFSQINMNEHPFLQTQQPTSIQSSAVKPTDFLAQLNQQEKQPTMADLLRTRIA